MAVKEKYSTVLTEVLHVYGGAAATTQSASWKIPFPIRLRRIIFSGTTDGSAGATGTGFVQVSRSGSVVALGSGGITVGGPVIAAFTMIEPNSTVASDGEAANYVADFGEGLRFETAQEIWVHVLSTVSASYVHAIFCYERV